MNRYLSALTLWWMASLLPLPVSSDSTSDTATTDNKITTEDAAGAAATIIGGKKAAAVKAIDHVTGDQLTQGVKKGVDAVADTAKEGVKKVTGSSSEDTTSENAR